MSNTVIGMSSVLTVIFSGFGIGAGGGDGTLLFDAKLLTLSPRV